MEIATALAAAVSDQAPAAPADPGALWVFGLGTAIFVLTYLAIAFEKSLGVDKTISALFGASLMLLMILNVPAHEAPPEPPAAAVVLNETADTPAGSGTETATGDARGGETTSAENSGGGHAGPSMDSFSLYVDFNVIFLLAGMMIIVNQLRDTGVFQYLAIKCAKVGRGQPLPVLALLLVITAVLSAFLDNVTTVLLIAPVTLLVAEQLKVDPLAFLIPEALSSNIGGTATLIGDPPNILVGSYAGLDFLAFLRVLSPFIVGCMVFFVAAIMLALRGKMRVTAEQRARIMDLNERRAITDVPLLWKSGIVMLLTLAGFALHGFLHLEPGVVAMGGASLLLVLSRPNIEKVLEEVEWPTLFFFLGLFVVVNGAERAGLMDLLATVLLKGTAGSPAVAAVLVLWVSGLCAGVMNNVSYTAAALPIVNSVAASLNLDAAHAEPLWWALALGACLGGNLTPVGAAANLVVAGISAKGGHRIGFGNFMKWGVPCALLSLVAATGYVLLLTWRVG